MKIEYLDAYGFNPELVTILRQRYGETLLPVQVKAIRGHHILSGGNFIVFAATSSGKTLIGELLALFYAQQKKRVFYLVPTRALAELSLAELKKFLPNVRCQIASLPNRLYCFYPWQKDLPDLFPGKNCIAGSMPARGLTGPPTRNNCATIRKRLWIPLKISNG